MSFPTRPEYETLIYGLPEAHPEILKSTLHLYSTSALTAIKHNRQPAPGISFDSPNLSTLIADCVTLGQAA
jgi:hypothetical protein